MSSQISNSAPQPPWAPQNYKLMSRIYVDKSLTCKVVSHNVLDALAVTRSETVVAEFDPAEYTFVGSFYSTPESEPDQWSVELDLPIARNTVVWWTMRELGEAIVTAALDLVEELEYRSDAVGIFTVAGKPIPAISDAIN